MKNPPYKVYPDSLVLNPSLPSQKKRFSAEERRKFRIVLEKLVEKWTIKLGGKPIPPNLMQALRGAAARNVRHPEVYEPRYGALLMQKKEAKARKAKLDAGGTKYWEIASKIHAANARARRERKERQRVLGAAADKGDPGRVLEGI